MNGLAAVLCASCPARHVLSTKLIDGCGVAAFWEVIEDNWKNRLAGHAVQL